MVFFRFLNFAKTLGADCIATGHYARLSDCSIPIDSKYHSNKNDHKKVFLRGSDPFYDQTYFLSMIQPGGLKNVEFPLEYLTKGIQLY